MCCNWVHSRILLCQIANEVNMTATAPAFTFETKSLLAKLLATENITMQHNPSVTTAYFDIKQRLLVLPVWQNISEDLYDLLVVHEVGHALDTDFEAWMAAIKKIAADHGTKTVKAETVIKDFLNVVEDARIDKRQKRRYPGSRKNYVKGYAELLNERDFFKIRGKDVNELTFIDRANIYFKGGYVLNIKFTPEERKLIVRMENAETFDDVVGIASDAYGYAITVEKEKQKEKEENNKEEFTPFESDEDMEIDMSSDDSDDMEVDMSTDDADDMRDELEGNQSPNDAGGDTETMASKSMDGADEDLPEVMTEQAARENMSSIVASDDTQYYFVDLPKIDHSKIVDDYKVVLNDMMKGVFTSSYAFSKEAINVYLNQLKEWKRNETAVISYMVKEFEMKKAADAYARTSVSKTGVIDTNKIHSYKFNEDIFRKVSVTANGKNHGFVMFLDWSGSMFSNLQNTLKQLFSLVMFCKRVQIPFEVYFFRNTVGTDPSWQSAERGDWFNSNSETKMLLMSFRLRNILSSRMNTADFNRAMECLWMASRRALYCDLMNSTPLNETILAADHLVNQFRKNNKVQVVSTIFLTDGAGDYLSCSRSVWETKKSNFVWRDTVTKKTYYNVTTRDQTPTLLKVLKERTQSNMIGFYLHSGNLRDLNYMIDDTVLHSDQTIKSWKEDHFFGAKCSGYDEYYIINSRKLADTAAASLNVDTKMTKNRVAREFMKYSHKKTVSRAMLSKFITRVVQDNGK